MTRRSQVHNDKLKQRVQSYHAGLLEKIEGGHMSAEVAGYVFDQYMTGLGDAIASFGYDASIDPGDRGRLLHQLDPHFSDNLSHRRFRHFKD